MAVKIFKDKINKTLKDTGLKTFKKLGDYAQSYITEEKRDFPRTTIREFGVGVTGIIARSPRDMVDSGETRDSFTTLTTDLGNGLVVTFSWDTPQAIKQYLGFGDVPPYPFVHFAINTFPLEKTFQYYWSQN
jgi:hypothetical protein